MPPESSPQAQGGGDPAPGDGPTLRERVEVALFITVEAVCVLLFIDFLFVGWYVK